MSGPKGRIAGRTTRGRTLPSGVVTFVLTDVEGSSRLWEAAPGPMANALERLDLIVESTVEQNRGTVIRTRGEGDSHFAVFSRPRDALAAARAVQHALSGETWPTPGPIRVRMALHTGEAELRAGDYYGAAVNRCARLREIAHGGQTILSEVTAELARDIMPEDVSLRDLGSHRLRDLVEPERVFQLCHPDLAQDFPPLRSLGALPTNLQVQLTSFVGREREMEAVKKALVTVRLLTLTGSGGVGKSRLAVQLAADLLDEHPDGVWLVEFAGLSDPGLVPWVVASTLRVREEPGRPLPATLGDFLSTKHLLLILDNCEHVIEASAQLAADLLGACPHLTILATSREALGVPGEITWRVPSLSAPDPARLPATEAIARFEAVRLFAERAAANDPSFVLTGKRAPSVAQICHRLDGIPLAIELAAARAKVLTTDQIAARLDDRFRLLTRGARTAPPRHRTLRGAIDWSYDLLSPVEQLLFRRMAVFASGCSLEAAEAVCAGEGLAESEVLEHLSSLVDKSLLMVEEQEGRSRYRMLETIRHYAGEKLAASGEESEARADHLAWFASLAEQAEPRLVGAEQTSWLDRLEAEHDNLRRALDWAVNRDAEKGLDLAAALYTFWFVRGHWTEARRRLARALSATPDTSSTTRAKALGAAGALASVQGDHEEARSLVEASLRMRRDLGDQHGVAAALNNLATLIAQQGDFGAARPMYEESLALRRELGDRQGVSASLNNLGNIAVELGDYAEARSLYEQSLEIARELGDKSAIVGALNNVGSAAAHQGDYAAARARYEESLTIARELGNKRVVSMVLNGLGAISVMQGDYGAARAPYEESLAIARDLGDRRSTATCLVNLGELAAHQRDFEEARPLLEESLAIRRELADRAGIADAVYMLGNLARFEEQYGQARERYREALSGSSEIGNRKGITECLEGLAAVAGAQNDFVRAARLFGAAEALREAIGSPIAPFARERYERDVAAARGGLDEETFEAVWAEGHALPVDEVIGYAGEEPR